MFAPGKKLKKGFTLVELLVTISIFVILTGIVLFSQTKFNSTILLTNLAYDTALTVRQAQTYGINIKEFNNNGTGVFVPYGVHFETGANNKSFLLYADLAARNIFNGTTITGCISSEGCVSRYNIQRGNYISGLYATNNSSCSTTTNSVQKLDLLFQRPNPDAKIYANGVNTTTYAKACIKVSSSDNSNTREIDVQANGLIQVVD